MGSDWEETEDESGHVPYEPPVLIFLGSVEQMTLDLCRGPFDAGDGFRLVGPPDIC